MNPDEVQSTQSYAYDPVEPQAYANEWVAEKEKCFIVAGSLREFDEYVKKKRNQYAILRQECPYDYFYVSGVDSLRGHTITKGFYIGNWRNRKDIEDIKQIVAINKSRGVVNGSTTT